MKKIPREPAGQIKGIQRERRQRRGGRQCRLFTPPEHGCANSRSARRSCCRPSPQHSVSAPGGAGERSAEARARGDERSRSGREALPHLRGGLAWNPPTSPRAAVRASGTRRVRGVVDTERVLAYVGAARTTIWSRPGADGAHAITDRKPGGLHGALAEEIGLPGAESADLGHHCALHRRNAAVGALKTLSGRNADRRGRRTGGRRLARVFSTRSEVAELDRVRRWSPSRA